MISLNIIALEEECWHSGVREQVMCISLLSRMRFTVKACAFAVKVCNVVGV